MRAVNSEPYKGIVKSLELLDLHIEDETSPGSDEVCFSYVLSCREGSWRLSYPWLGDLRLSFVRRIVLWLPPMGGVEPKTRLRQP